jgi:hypothetical protein
MLLVIDVGNTNTVLGVYEGATLRHDFRIESARGRTADEYVVTMRVDARAPRHRPVGQVTASALACVVPALTETFSRDVRTAFDHEPDGGGPRHQDRHAHPLRAAARGGRRPHRQRRRRLRAREAGAHRGGLRHRHHLRRA